ncbi:MAG: dicarboxylate/amino acid:cation symporter, partial [Kiritimatiellae bacterium]|nr:dicarboxylate/amino acid:cation symporter [Kiritimatiellia bacterium]
MKVKFGLLPRIVLAITIGVLLGGYVPGVVVRAFNTFSGLFDQFIRFMVPLIIIGLVVPAIADTGRKAGKMLLVTVALAYVSTLAAGLFSYGVSVNVFPSLVERGSATAVNAVGAEFPAFVKVAIPAMVDVMSALVFAFIMGLGIVFSESTVLKSAADEM